MAASSASPSDEEQDLTAGSGGVYKRTIRQGTAGGSKPSPSADVTVHYEGFLLSGQKFDSSRERDEPFKFKLGVGQVIEGWDIAVASMTPGEAAIFTCRADYAYGWEGKPPKIPVDATLRFEVELISWTPGVKEIADMTPSEKLDHGLAKRESGTALLKAGEYASASTELAAAIESLLTLRLLQLAAAATPPDRLAQVSSALVSCYLNVSQCQLKLQQWEAADTSCSRVLDIEKSHIKALFRRGVARTSLERFEEAMDDLKAACTLDPKSKDIREAHANAKAAHDAHKQAERQAFGGMFKNG